MQINLKIYMHGASPLEAVQTLYDENKSEMNELGYGFLAGDDQMVRLVLTEGSAPYKMADFLMKKFGTAVKVEIDAKEKKGII